MIAVVPVITAGARTDWRSYEQHSRSEFASGGRFEQINGESTIWYLTLARWACIPFSLVGAIVCYVWARELYGTWPGMLALVLWCFCPTILGHAQLITPDAPAAALGILAGYTFWRWLKKPTWGAALWAGIALGLCELTKSTWIVLFGLWPMLWVVWRMGDWWQSKSGKRKAESGERAGSVSDGRQSQESRVESQEPDTETETRSVSDGHSNEARSVSERRAIQSGERKAESGGVRIWVQGVQLALVLVVAVFVLNAGYGYENTFQRLGDIPFISSTLRHSQPAAPLAEGSNRFRGTWMGAIRLPVPANYVRGIDVQKHDFEMNATSYMAGQWKDGGRWYYYLYALGVKTPVGTLALVALALALCFRRGYAGTWRDELCVLAPLLVILVFVSSQTGLNHHMRYVLPMFGFAFVWMSMVARSFQFSVFSFQYGSGRVAKKVTATFDAQHPAGRSGQRWLSPFSRPDRFVAGAVVLCIAASVGSSLWVYPHSLSYFNELVGGPRYGYRHLNNSNIDWNQDLLYLGRWYEEHPEARPLGVVLFRDSVNPRLVGIESVDVPVRPDLETPYGIVPRKVGPLPGWYAVSVNWLVSRDGEYDYFRELEPVGRAGYSIYIYHLTLDDANALRRQYGLPELPDVSPPESQP
jgi:hypothetical protein